MHSNSALPVLEGPARIHLSHTFLSFVDQWRGIATIIDHEIAAIGPWYSFHLLSAPPEFWQSFALPCEDSCGTCLRDSRSRMVLDARMLQGHARTLAHMACKVSIKTCV